MILFLKVTMFSGLAVDCVPTLTLRLLREGGIDAKDEDPNLAWADSGFSEDDDGFEDNE
jgi:hypothetical protein